MLISWTRSSSPNSDRPNRVAVNEFVVRMSAPASKYCPLRPADQVRLGQYEDVDAAPQVPWMVREGYSSIVRFLKPDRLQRYAPRPVEYHHALFEDSFEL